MTGERKEYKKAFCTTHYEITMRAGLQAGGHRNKKLLVQEEFKMEITVMYYLVFQASFRIIS